MASAPAMPPTPNPYAVAQAQTSSNIDTAVANTFLQNADEDSPQGTIRYSVKSTYAWQQPTQDKDGVVTGSITRSIPRFQRTIALTPKSQDIFDKQQTSQSEMMDWVLRQTQNMKTVMNSPFSLSGLPAPGSAPAIQTLQSNIAAPAIVRTKIGSDNGDALRQRALDAVAARTDFLINRDRSAMIVKLQNQGIVPGMRAYYMEMSVFDHQVTDARNRDFLAAGQEATRIFQIDQQNATFENAAQQQMFTQSAIVAEFFNKTSMQRFAMLHQVSDFLNVLRERGLQERVVERSTSVNEITALLHGGQVQQPQFAQFKSGHIQDTPVGQYVFQAAALDTQKWQVQQQSQQQLMGGIMGMFGNILGAGMMGGNFGRLGGIMG